MQVNNVLFGLLGMSMVILFLVYSDEITGVMFEQLPKHIQLIVKVQDKVLDNFQSNLTDSSIEEEDSEDREIVDISPRFNPKTTPRILDQFDFCPLKHKDPWEDEFIEKLGKSSKTTCTPDELMTKFKDGIVELNEKNPKSKGHTCQGRCIYYKENYAIRADPWNNTKDHRFDCDHVHVECRLPGKERDYAYVHMQIKEYERDRLKDFGYLGVDTKAKKIRKDRFHPDVYIFILDAMSMTGGFRQMPETMIFLEESLEAVPYRYVSKVAENSKPNSIAFLFGEIPIPVDRRVFGVKEVLHHTLDENESCGRALDNESYVMFEYEDAGYKTMWGCDFYLVNFGYTSCVGIKNQLSTHYMRPFQIQTAYIDDKLLKSFVFDRPKCRYPYTHLLDYQQKFIDSYKGTPKMSLIWSVDVSHDSEKGMASTDSTFRKFFEDNKHKFDDSIVIVMGDHGPRYDGATNTKQGLYDRINPLMMLALPKRLRGSKMHKTLKRNSEELSSHHDLHATLVDIIRHQPEKNFTDTTYLRINGTYGSSWLREFEAGVPRTCRSLPIPSQYCLCDYGQIEITDSKLKSQLGNMAVRNINTYLHERRVSDVCEDLELDEVQKLLSIPSSGYKGRYRLHFSTKRGARLLTTYVRKENDLFELLEREWDRTNKYGNTADCLKDDAKNYDLRILCFCKKQN